MRNAGLDEAQAGIKIAGRWSRKWQPTPVFFPGESQGWRSLVGCHLWARTVGWLKQLSCSSSSAPKWKCSSLTTNCQRVAFPLKPRLYTACLNFFLFLSSFISWSFSLLSNKVLLWGLKKKKKVCQEKYQNTSNLRYADDTTLMAESEAELKSLLMKAKEESEKSWLKTQHSEKQDHGIWSYHFMANRWGNSDRLYSSGLQNHRRWWLWI